MGAVVFFKSGLVGGGVTVTVLESTSGTLEDVDTADALLGTRSVPSSASLARQVASALIAALKVTTSSFSASFRLLS